MSFSRAPTNGDVDAEAVRKYNLNYDNIDLPLTTVLIGACPEIHHVLESTITRNGLLLTRTPLGVAIMGTPSSAVSGSEEVHAVNFIGLDHQPERFFWDNKSCPSIYDQRKAMSFKSSDSRSTHRRGRPPNRRPFNRQRRSQLPEAASLGRPFTRTFPMCCGSHKPRA